MQRIPWIDPLRGVAAGLVLVSHVAYWSGGSSIDGVGRLLARGDVGVAVFFAVSAYLLTRGASAGRPRRGTTGASAPHASCRPTSSRSRRSSPSRWRSNRVRSAWARCCHT